MEKINSRLLEFKWSLGRKLFEAGMRRQSSWSQALPLKLFKATLQAASKKLHPRPLKPCTLTRLRATTSSSTSTGLTPEKPSTRKAQALPSPRTTYLFKDSYKEIIVRKLKNVGYLGSRYALQTLQTEPGGKALSPLLECGSFSCSLAVP